MKITKTKGFSVLEVMIVLAIVAITASIATFYAIRYGNNNNLRIAARQLAMDISTLKEQAYQKNSNYTISFNQTANTYTINGPTVLTKSLSSFGKGVIFSSLPGGGSTYTLTFLSRGTLSFSIGAANCTSSSGTCWIVLNNNNPNPSSATITFGLTGKTYVTYTMH